MPEPIAMLVGESSLPAGGQVFSEALRLSVLPPRVVLHLQIGARSQKSVGAIRIAERPLPLPQNSWNGEDPVFCRIASNAWLIQSALHDAGELMHAVRKGCGRRSYTVTEVSDAWVTLALEGALAAALLGRGCALDLSPSAFGEHACTRTRVAQLPVILRRTGSERFECAVDRSAAQHLHEWFRDAAVALVAP